MLTKVNDFYAKNVGLRIAQYCIEAQQEIKMVLLKNDINEWIYPKYQFRVLAQALQPITIPIFKKVNFDPLFLLPSNSSTVLFWDIAVETTVWQGIKFPAEWGALAPINPCWSQDKAFFCDDKNKKYLTWPLTTTNPYVVLQKLHHTQICYWNILLCNTNTQQSMVVHPFQTTFLFSLLPFLVQIIHMAFLGGFPTLVGHDRICLCCNAVPQFKLPF